MVKLQSKCLNLDNMELKYSFSLPLLAKSLKLRIAKGQKHHSLARPVYTPRNMWQLLRAAH